MEYEVRKANESDLMSIGEIYAYARYFMAQHGNPNQWGNSKPELKDLKDDIRKGNLYVVVNQGTIYGVFAFILGEDPTYIRIYEGSWRSREPYGTIHRIAGNGAGGILHTCVAYCEKIISYLRIDTHQDNYVMQNAVKKEGFEKCGIIYIADGSPRIAYDRLV